MDSLLPVPWISTQCIRLLSCCRRQVQIIISFLVFRFYLLLRKPTLALLRFIMVKHLLVAAAFTASILASPIQERDTCWLVTDVVNIMHAQNVATPFCSSLLSIPTITTSVTKTSTPPCTTITTSVATTGTTTSISTSVVYGTTTVDPVQR